MSPSTTTAWVDELQRLDLPEAPDPGGRLVVVSAHPDDEVLGVGAWLAGQTAREVTFVVATDGEASHPDSPTVTPQQLRRRRRIELADALGTLDHGRPRVAHLGLRDAALPEDEDILATRLTELLAGASLVVAPYEHDGHGDHDVVGRVALAVAPDRARVWRYPVWRWVWTEPADGTAWLDRAAALPASGAARDLKALALQAFTTQVTALSPDPADQPVVPPALITHSLTAPEVVIT